MNPYPHSLAPGRYRTAAGSRVLIFGDHGGCYEIDWSWIDENGACCDCKPYVTREGEFSWECEKHDSGKAALSAECG